MRRIALALLVVGVAACSGKEAAPVAAAPAPVAAAPVPVAAPAAPVAGAPGAPGMPGMPGAGGAGGAGQAAALAALQQQQLAALGAGAGQQKPVVNWRDMLPLLTDELAGWKAQGDASGETSAMAAFHVSHVKRAYKKDALSADVEIVDTAMMPALVQAFSMARLASKDGSDGYARGGDLAGSPSWEEWRKGGRAEVTALVAKRFLVKAHAGGLPDTKALTELVGKIDLGKLAALDK